MSRTQTKHAIAKIVLEKAEALQSDEWGERHAIRTDIVARPSKRRREAIPTPDPDDPTTRMAPDRVMALLKAQQAFPEPLEPTPGSPTRVLDAAEVAQAQAQPPEPKRPFEVVESVPARPPRAPRIPSDFSTIPAEKTPAEKTPATVNHRESLKARFKRVGGLMLMALLVFALTFGITKALRDDSALSRARETLIETYDRAAARVDAWFGATAAERAAPTATAPATAPKAAPPAPLKAAPEPSEPAPPVVPEPSEPAPPVVRLEDLKLLGSGSAKPAKQPPPAHR